MPAQPEFIKIGNGVEIAEINPNPTFRGQIVEVSAIGLSPFVNQNYFYISNKSGGTTKIPLLSAPVNNIAKIKIPQDAVTGTLTLEVIRIINNIPEVIESEPVNIEIKDSLVQFAMAIMVTLMMINLPFIIMVLKLTKPQSVNEVKSLTML